MALPSMPPQSEAASRLTARGPIPTSIERAIRVVALLIDEVNSLVANVDIKIFRAIEDTVRKETGMIMSDIDISDGKLNAEELVDSILLAVQRAMGEEHVLSKHLPSVGALSRVLAMEMGYTDDIAALAYRAGAMHDVGKLDPDISDIIELERKFKKDEWNAMKLHTGIGNYALQMFGVEPAVSRVAANHHEKLNGNGYPEGLTEKEIDPITQLVSVADAIDAMLADRPGRTSKSLGYVISELNDDVRKNKFDKMIVEAFIKMCSESGIDTEKNIKTMALLNQCGKLQS